MFFNLRTALYRILADKLTHKQYRDTIREKLQVSYYKELVFNQIPKRIILICLDLNPDVLGDFIYYAIHIAWVKNPLNGDRRYTSQDITGKQDIEGQMLDYMFKNTGMLLNLSIKEGKHGGRLMREKIENNCIYTEAQAQAYSDQIEQYRKEHHISLSW